MNQRITQLEEELEEQIQNINTKLNFFLIDPLGERYPGQQIPVVAPPLSQFFDEFDSTINAHGSRLDTIESIPEFDPSDIEDQIQTINNRVTQLEDAPGFDPTSLETAISTLDTRIQTLENAPGFDPTSLETAISTLDTRIETLENAQQFDPTDLENAVQGIDNRVTTLEETTVVVPAFNPESEKTIVYTGPFAGGSPTITINLPADFMPDKPNIQISEIQMQVFMKRKSNAANYPNFLVDIATLNTWRDTDNGGINRGLTIAQGPSQVRQFSIIIASDLVGMIGQNYFYWTDVSELIIHLKPISIKNQLQQLSISGGEGDVTQIQFNQLQDRVETIETWKPTISASVTTLEAWKPTADSSITSNSTSITSLQGQISLMGIEVDSNSMRIQALEDANEVRRGISIFQNSDLNNRTFGLRFGQNVAIIGDNSDNTRIIEWDDVSALKIRVKESVGNDIQDVIILNPSNELNPYYFTLDTVMMQGQPHVEIKDIILQAAVRIRTDDVALGMFEYVIQSSFH